MGLPVLAMFAIWLVYGALQWRRSGRLMAGISRIERSKKPALGMLLLIGGAVVLLGGLYGVFVAGGFADQGVAAWAWPVCVIVGLAFVHTQVLAGALLISMAVTQDCSGPSQNKETQR